MTTLYIHFSLLCTSYKYLFCVLIQQNCALDFKHVHFPRVIIWFFWHSLENQVLYITSESLKFYLSNNFLSYSYLTLWKENYSRILVPTFFLLLLLIYTWPLSLEMMLREIIISDHQFIGEFVRKSRWEPQIDFIFN